MPCHPGTRLLNGRWPTSVDSCDLRECARKPNRRRQEPALAQCLTGGRWSIRVTVDMTIGLTFGHLAHIHSSGANPPFRDQWNLGRHLLFETRGSHRLFDDVRWQQSRDTQAGKGVLGATSQLSTSAGTIRGATTCARAAFECMRRGTRFASRPFAVVACWGTDLVGWAACCAHGDQCLSKHLVEFAHECDRLQRDITPTGKAGG